MRKRCFFASVIACAVTATLSATTGVNWFGQYDVNSAPNYDPGSDTFRGLADVNGDGKADYCRAVGSAPNVYLSCGLSNGTSFGANDVNSPAGYDFGYAAFRGLADVNGDRKADFCRIVGSAPSNIYLSCGLSTGTTFGNNDYNSPQGYDIGNDTFRGLADVNGDGKADFCRFVGNAPNVYFSCGLSNGSGFGTYDVNSAPGIDPGFTFRAMADVNGDGKADYCRLVGNAPSVYLSCALSTGTAFGNYDFNSAPGIDPGYDTFRAMVDVNGDGRADFCRFVGNPPYLLCTLATATGFGGDVVASATGFDAGSTIFRGMADVNGDGRADYVRFPANAPGIVLSAGLAAQIYVIDTIPFTLSAETNQDSEPFLSVHPTDLTRMVASAFIINPAGQNAPTAPILVTSNGGATWSLNAIVPSQARTNDITHAFSAGTATGPLYAGILPLPSQQLDYDNLVTMDFLAPPPPIMTVQATRPNVDQPFVQANRAANNRLYVGVNDHNAAPYTATVDVTTTGGPPFNSVRIETRPTVGADGPAVRPAYAPSDGRVYAGYFGWRSQPAPGTYISDVVIVRDDQGGIGATPFRSLMGPPAGTQPGTFVASNVTIPWSPTPTLGYERIGSTLSVAVDPTNSAIVYVAWGDRTGSDIYTLHIRRSTDAGVSWSSDLRVLHNATNPALAITTTGVTGVMYQQLYNGRWITHLEQTKNAFTSITDNVLANTPADTPYPQFLPYLGDYAFMMAINSEFRGIFSANNTPSASNFPSSVVFQRAVDPGSGTLLNPAGGTVPISIDPFYFRVVAIP
jgi:hypothetical protein